MAADKAEKSLRTEHSDKEKRRNDMVLVIFVLLFCLVSFSAEKLLLSGERGEAVITLDGEEILRCPLRLIRDAETEEELRAGAEVYEDGLLSFSEERVEVRTSIGYNIIEYAESGDGKEGLRCSSADCPDLVCVDQGVISSSTEAIVCLPHRLIARIEQ